MSELTLEAVRHRREHNAKVISYISAHSFLAIGVSRSGEVPSDTIFLRCFYCSTLPTLTSWTISDLQVLKIDERQFVVCDVENGISIHCEYVDVVRSFDIRKYLAADKPDHPI